MAELTQTEPPVAEARPYPPPRLSADQRERYDRNILVPGIGEEGQERLLAARVLVVGAGGLGTPVILYLTAAGVGHLAVADADVVEATNLQRQVIHGIADVGIEKTVSAERAIRGLNADVQVERLGWITPENAEEIFSSYDLVLECSDNFDAKFTVADACAATGVPLVWGTIVSMTYQVTVLHSRPARGRPAVTLRDIHPVQPASGTTDGAPQVGVLGAAVGQAGSVMATEAVKVITGIGEPLLGRLLIGDARAAAWDVIPVGRRP
nr:HesA/MoeB/ThiF family protein [Actinomycetales bacterium]